MEAAQHAAKLGVAFSRLTMRASGGSDRRQPPPFNRELARFHRKVDAVEQPDLFEHFLGGGDVDEDYARVDRRAIRRQDAGDVQHDGPPICDTVNDEFARRP